MCVCVCVLYIIISRTLCVLIFSSFLWYIQNVVFGFSNVCFIYRTHFHSPHRRKGIQCICFMLFYLDQSECISFDVEFIAVLSSMFFFLRIEKMSLSTSPTHTHTHCNTSILILILCGFLFCKYFNQRRIVIVLSVILAWCHGKHRRTVPYTNARCRTHDPCVS